MEQKKTSELDLWDFLIVLINVAAGRGNYLLFGLTGFTKGTWVSGIVIIIDLLYLCIRGNIHLVKIKYSPFTIIFVLFFYNWLSVIIQGNGDFVTITEITTIWVLFYLILSRLYSKLTSNPSLTLREGVSDLSKGYVWLSLISIIGVFASFLALHFGIVGGGKSLNLDYMEANSGNVGGSIYEWTFLTVNDVSSEFGRIPLFQDYGVLTGLFHEPNIIAHNITPCIILLLGLVESRFMHYIVLLTGILMMLFSGSVTNILVVGVCLLLYVFINFRSSAIVSILTAGFAIAFVVLFIQYSDDTFVKFFLGRMDSGNASNAYTSSVLEHTFVPHTLFGYNFLSTSYVSEEGVLNRSLDVGVIPWVLNIAFLVMYFRNVVLLIIKKDKIAMAVGFASLYYILHAAKGGMTIFFQLLLALFVFMQLYVLNSYGAVRNNKRGLRDREETKA